MTRTIIIPLLIAISFISSNAQSNKLKGDIERLVKDKKATIGVSIIANNGKDTININERLHYPMQSVFKFPIALAVLSEVDKGRLRLSQAIQISPKELLPNTWSPIRDQFPKGTTMSLADLIQYTVSQSDNNGCDILLRLIGGPVIVEKILSQHQIKDIAIKTNEEQMHKAWNIQYQNWSTPIALTKLLTKFYAPHTAGMLSKGSYDFLWRTMSETSTGTNRLKGQLPSGTIVAHKTGTSGANSKQITAAVNDIGIIILPNGKPVFISILVSNSAEDGKTNERIIADIAKATWDYYTR